MLNSFLGLGLLKVRFVFFFFLIFVKKKKKKNQLPSILKKEKETKKKKSVLIPSILLKDTGATNVSNTRASNREEEDYPTAA